MVMVFCALFLLYCPYSAINVILIYICWNDLTAHLTCSSLFNIIKFNSVWPSDAICWHESTFPRVMACCQMAPHCDLNKCYRNWPRYGLRWSGLCCHSRHSTSGAGGRAAACGRLHECCAGSGSTNHDNADRMSGQFLFYHENEAIHNDKSRDDHDIEPPGWNALGGNAIVMMKASIDTVSE